MKSEELNRVINTLIAIKDEDEFYIKLYAKELIKAYAKACVIEELTELIKDVEGYVSIVPKHLIKDRIEELKQE